MELDTVDGTGLTPLMYAAASNAEIVAYLIQNGAETQIKCNQGKTAMEYAKEFENESAYEILMARSSVNHFR